MKRPYRLNLSSDEAQVIAVALRRDAIRVEVDGCYSPEANRAAEMLRNLAKRTLRL